MCPFNITESHLNFYCGVGAGKLTSSFWYPPILVTTVGSFRGAGIMARIRQHSPHIVLVMLGGNDIGSRSPHLVASGLCLLATELLAIGVQQVGLCQIEHRGKWRQCSVEEGTEWADSVNARVDAECQGSVSQFYWRHKSLWTSPVRVFRSDQVHYNDVGNLRLYRSIRGAIFKALSRYHQTVVGRSGNIENVR